MNIEMYMYTWLMYYLKNMYHPPKPYAITSS